MERMKNKKEEAYADMKKVQPAQWTRSAFSTNTKCDLQVNNMCEAFNRAILSLREKPIFSLLEGVKHYIILRIVKQRQMLERYNGEICPNIQKIIEKNKRKSGGWKATWHCDADMAMFSVGNATDTYVVNLADRTCSCRKWEITGIPCPHAIGCIWHNGLTVESYVSSYYRKSKCLATYAYIVLPSNEPRLWPVTNTEHIHPPEMRRAPGRPEKLRNKANDEPKKFGVLPRQLKKVKCTHCGKYGHNSRTCKGKSVADRVIPRGGNKQPKKKKKGSVAEVIGQGSQAPQPSQN